MAFRPSNTTLGEFQEAEKGNWFTYSAAPKASWGYNNDLPFVVDVGYDEYRFAIIKQTVVYICIHEDLDGKPILEKWKIKKHNTYNKGV